jgi:hypothetical protein
VGEEGVQVFVFLCIAPISNSPPQAGEIVAPYPFAEVSIARNIIVPKITALLSIAITLKVRCVYLQGSKQ